MPEDYCIWGYEGGCTMTVLECVFSWLSGRELARAGEVCRVWRYAAAAPTHWRRLLHSEKKASLTAIRALSGHVADGDLNPSWSWRNEYVNAAAGWQRLKTLRPPEGETGEGDVSATILQHAALNSTGELLAVAGDDASVSVWIRTSECGTNWKMAWTTSLRRRGWRSAARVIWAPPPSPGYDERLLLAGPLALADRWELLIIELSEDCESGRILARAGCSNGAAGCWASRDAFLSLELRLLAPRRAVTTIWINAATQEAQSEFTGVSAPVLRIYNEAQANISHITVAEVPTESEEELSALSQDAKYMRVTVSEGVINKNTVSRLVIAGCGQEGGTTGIATAIGCWWLGTLRVPPLVAALSGGLAERVARRRHNPRGIEPEPPPPSENDLRELCSPPTALYRLEGRLLGITIQPNGRCIWAVDASGRATCLALPLLDVLRVLHTVSANLAVRPYYVQPAVSQWLIASPMCGDGSSISIWSALSGAEYTPPAAVSCTITAVVLPPTNTQQPKVFLCIAGDAIYTHTGMALPRSLAVVTSLARSPRIKCVQRAKTTSRSSCDDKSRPPPCPPCQSAPQPPCRGKVHTQQLAERIVCCSPSVGCRPPCAIEEPICSTNCSNLQSQERKSTALAQPDPAIEDLSTCDANRDAVAKRLEIAETARRAAYLREVRDRKPEPKPEPAKYRLKGAAECVHATDGRSYGIESSTPATARCGSCREAPPPCCVKLTADNECRPRGDTGVLDPCAHRPRTVISIDRSQRDAETAQEKPKPPNSANPAPPPAISATNPLSNEPVAEGLTSRIMKSLKLSRTSDGTESKKLKQSAHDLKKPCTTRPGAPRWAGDTSWCASLKTPIKTPPRCRPPTAAERLRRRSTRHDQRNHKPLIPRRDCSPPRRYLHTSTICLDKEKKIEPKDIESSAKNLRAMLKSRAALKEIARGRVVHGAEKCGGVNASGGLELPVPTGAAAVRVNVVVGSTRNTDTSENHKTSPTSTVTVTPRNPCSPLGKSSKLDKTLTNSSCSPDTRDSAKPNTETKTSNTIKSSVPGDDHGKWLSLKSLQKMVTPSRKKNESEPVLKVLNKSKAEPCRPPCGPRTISPCPPLSRKPSNKSNKLPQTPPSRTKKSPCQPLVKPSNKPSPPPQNPKSPCERSTQPKKPQNPCTPSKN